MLAVYNRTSCSLPDKDGERYHASFGSTSSMKGVRKKVYKGVLHGKGSRKGEKVLVKAFREKEQAQSLCDVEIDRYRQAQELARKFNRRIPNKEDKIHFTVPMKVSVEKIAIKNYLSRGRGKVSPNEWVIMEHDLGKEFREFVKKNGARPFKDPTFLDAFLHFTFHETLGKFVICGFHGIQTEHGYQLSCPVIHSVEQCFGETDKGSKAIIQAFELHKCTNLCYDMRNPLPHDHECRKAEHHILKSFSM